MKIFWLLAIILLGLFNRQPVWAESVTVPVTVKTSLCGDDVIEEPEDCEGNLLNGQNCHKLGYQSGLLTCDQACEFDTSLCNPYPSPSPSPSPSAAATTSTSTETNQSVSQQPSGLINQLIKAVLPQTQRLIIPPGFNRFDRDGSGRIEKSEMAEAVRQWVDSWHSILEEKFAALPSPETSKLVALLEAKPTEDEVKIQPGEVKELEVFTGQIEVSEEELEYCDLSGDRDCNLIDLSILLYFISGQ